MIQLLRTNSEHPDFILLVEQLDAYLRIADGNQHEFYNQYNNIDVLKHVVLAYSDDLPVGCGAIKEFDNNSVEIKRMFTTVKSRGQGVASKILTELETWAKELNYSSCILETGKRQVEAIELYKKNNYSIINNYAPYINVENSICYKLML